MPRSKVEDENSMQEAQRRRMLYGFGRLATFGQKKTKLGPPLCRPRLGRACGSGSRPRIYGWKAVSVALRYQIQYRLQFASGYVYFAISYTINRLHEVD